MARDVLPGPAAVADVMGRDVRRGLTVPGATARERAAGGGCGTAQQVVALAAQRVSALAAQRVPALVVQPGRRRRPRSRGSALFGDGVGTGRLNAGRTGLVPEVQLRGLCCGSLRLNTSAP